MRPRKDVVIYGANPASLDAFVFVLGVRAHWARVIVAATVDELQRAVSQSTNFGCAMILCRREERARLKQFMEVCGDVPTLLVRLGTDRHVLDAADSPCTATAHFLLPREVLEHLRLLCARKRGPQKKAAERAA